MDYNRLPSCPHLDSEHASIVDVNKLENVKSCASCDYSGLNLWICLQRNCLRVGCSEAVHDHSTEHFQRNNKHCVHLNLSSQRAWCYLCEREVFLEQPQQARQDLFLTGSGSTSSKRAAKNVGGEANPFVRFSTVDTMGGLVGLQNIANTCYMNSALQALSNVLPLTNYFLNCGDLVQHTLEHAAHRSKAGLAKSYQHLMHDIWERQSGHRDYIAPRGLLYSIRSVNSMFRGYHQHDTQEFLRCFMDQLHEELKESRPMSPQMALACTRTIANEQSHKKDNYANMESEGSSSASDSSSRRSSLSDSEYESCDSNGDGGGGSNRGTRNVTESYQYEASGTFVGSKQQLYAAPTGEQRKHRGSSSPQVPPQPAVRSIISDIFDGKLLSSVQCLTCDRISTREETFQDLSLPIPNRDHLNLLHQTHSLSAQSLTSIDATSARSVNDSWLFWLWGMLRSWLWGPSVTLHDCMASLFSADELKGDNMYSCEKCKKLRTGVKYSQILDLPEVLCIHLKRFRHDLSHSSKISSHVHFPLDGFDLRPYLHKDCNSHVALYQLVSVICHHGTVGGGHYTCYARNALSNLWYEYDDQHVIEVTPEIVQNCQAYVLFYQKYNPQMELLRAEANELASASPTTQLTNDIRFYVAREWLARFNTFAEPGPINNWVMLCPHGGLLQSKIDLIEQIAVPISQALWHFLYQKFGGGPAINMLYDCELCRQAAEALSRRQYYELIVFKKYNGLDEEELDMAIYAISMPWLRKWQQFVHGLTQKEPGPITNANIAPVMGATSTDLPPSTPICSVRPGSDYAQIKAPLWRFLHSIYGGGPEIMLRGSPNDEHIEIIDQDEYENESCEGHGDLSDTESNIGQRITLDFNESGRDRDREGERERERDYDQQQKSEITASSAKKSNESESVSTDSKRHIHLGVRESRNLVKYYSSSSSSRKSKAGIILRNSLRKKSMKSRTALKNTDLFGPRGCYSQHRSVDDADTQRLNAHSTESITNVVYKRVAFNTNHSNYQEAQQNEQNQQYQQQQQQSSFPTDSAQDSQFDNSNIGSAAGIVGDLSNKEYSTRSRSGRRRNRHSRGKHGITLQKFAQLHESSASTETDV